MSSTHTRSLDDDVVTDASIHSFESAYTPSAVKACLEGTPFSDAIRTNVLDYMRGTLTLDVFEENQKNTDDPILAQKVDVRAKLDEIATKTYASDYAFQSEISALMNSLNDGHYYWTTCYDFFATSHGIPIVALSQDGTSQADIYIPTDVANLIRVYASVDPAFYEGIDVESIAGAKVIQIDGKDSWAYIEDLAKESGVYQDYEQRINQIFASNLVLYGSWDHNPGVFTTPKNLDKDFLSMSIETTRGATMELDIPIRTYWTSRYPFSYSSSDDFFNSRCNAGAELPPSPSPTNGTEVTPPTNETLASIPSLLRKLPSGQKLLRPLQPQSKSTLVNGGDASALEREQLAEPAVQVDASLIRSERLGNLASASHLPDIKNFIRKINVNSTVLQQQLYFECPPNTQTATWPFPADTDPTRSPNYLGGRDIQFYKLDKAKTNNVNTGVIFVTTFSPAPADAYCFNRFILDTVLGLQNFTKAGVERIVVDTSNNGGGYVYLSGILQLALAGGQYEPDLNFEVLFRKAPMSVAAVEAYNQRPYTSIPGYWSPASLLDADSARPLSLTTNWMEPGVDFEVPPGTLKASNKVQFAPEDSLNQIETGPAGIAPFTGSEIIFTGNGLCGSACGGFTSFLAEYKNTTALISTARPAKEMTYTAFTSGNAVSSYYVDQELVGLGIPVTEYRPNLTTVAELGFSLSGSLSVSFFSSLGCVVHLARQLID